MGEVGGRRDLVVPVDLERVVEVMLQPHGRVGAEEQEPVDVARHLDLQRPVGAVGPAAALLVGEPHPAVADAVEEEPSPSPDGPPEVADDDEDADRDGHRDAVDDEALGEEPPQVADAEGGEESQPDVEPRVDGDHVVDSETRSVLRLRRGDDGLLSDLDANSRHERSSYPNMNNVGRQDDENLNELGGGVGEGAAGEGFGEVGAVFAGGVEVAVGFGVVGGVFGRFGDRWPRWRSPRRPLWPAAGWNPC